MLTLGARLDLLKRLARTMSGLHWSEVKLIFTQVGLTPPSGAPLTDYETCLTTLGYTGNDTLLDLDDYLHGPGSGPDGPDVDLPETAPWRSGMFRLFISHTSGRKAYAAVLRERLRRYGVEGFVAHEDVEPSREWRPVIEAALRSCDAGVALLHWEFSESSWCDQEVGFMLSRNVPVLPVSVDLQPYGFLGEVQSLPASGLDADALADQLAPLLLRTAAGSKHVEAMVEALVNAHSFRQANDLSAILAADAPAMTADQLTRLRRAQKDNPQVAGAWRVDVNMMAIEARFGLTPDDTSDMDDPSNVDDLGEEQF